MIFIPMLEEERPLTRRRRSRRGRVPKKEWDESPVSGKIFGDGSTPASREKMALLAELVMASEGHSRDPNSTYVVDVKNGSVKRTVNSK